MSQIITVINKKLQNSSSTVQTYITWDENVLNPISNQ